MWSTLNNKVYVCQMTVSDTLLTWPKPPNWLNLKALNWNLKSASKSPDEIFVVAMGKWVCSEAGWPNGQRLGEGWGPSNKLLTCFFLHQPDIHWLRSLQLVNSQTDLQRNRNLVYCCFIQTYYTFSRREVLTSSSVMWGERPHSIMVLLFFSSPGSLL